MYETIARRKIATTTKGGHMPADERQMTSEQWRAYWATGNYPASHGGPSVHALREVSAPMPIQVMQPLELDHERVETARCYHCDRSFPIADMMQDSADDNFYCQTHTFTCEGCDEVHGRGLESYRGYCESCSENRWACERCGETYDYNYESSNDVDGYYQWCDECVNRMYLTFCDECEHYHRSECPAVDPDDFYGRIMNYTFKPEPNFYDSSGIVPAPNGGRVAPLLYMGLRVPLTEWADRRPVIKTPTPTKPFFGFEIEIESGSSGYYTSHDAALECVNNAADSLIYCKHDGSLHNGFEMVSHPMSLEFVHGFDWSFLRRLAIDHGYRSWQTTTCGMHVHIGRTSFSSRSHLWKFSHLVARNRIYAQRFAGRSGSEWASFQNLRRNVTSYVTGNNLHPPRYLALNFQNRTTVECRMFRGTLRPERAVANIELLHAGIEYTRHMTVEQVKADSLKWGAFRDYMQAHDEYANACNIIEASPRLKGLSE